MFILHILTNRENDRAANYAAGVISGLHETGIAQCAVMHESASSYGKLKNAGIEVAPRVLRAGWRWRQRVLLHRLIQRLKPDVIHCWTRAAVRLVPKGKIPVIGWFGGYDDPHRFAPCAHFVGVTADITAHLIRHGVPRPSAHFIPAYSAITAAPPLDRNLLATPREARVLVSFSRLHPASRLDVLLAALADLPECYAWLVGEGPWRRELEKRAGATGVLERVRFAGVRLDRSALLRAADLCVLPGQDDPLGTVVQDAWVAGTPLVAAAEAGFVTPVENDADGLLVTAGEPRTLAHAIRRILEEENLRRRLVGQGYASGLGLYAREAVVGRWVGLYREAVASG